MKPAYFTLLLATGAASSRTVPGSTTIIAPTAVPGESIANFDPFTPDGPFTGIDGPNVKPINSTVFDWWYFDVVALPDDEESDTSKDSDADSSLASMVITFFTATNGGFPFLPPSATADNALTAYIWLTFPNDTWVSRYTHADQATVVTNPGGGGGGSSGEFESTGFRWDGAGDMSRYTITVDAEESMGMKGVLEMESITRPRIPCEGYDPTATATTSTTQVQNGLRPLEVAPELGWSNPIPDAIGTVDFTIDGSRLKFQGTAYHDKNWSPQPFDPALKTWYWGHARLGPYSLVWFDLVTGDERFVSAYVSCDSSVLLASCASSSVVVTPREGMGKGNFRVRFEVGVDEVLEVDVWPEQVIGASELEGVEYARWAGRVRGIVGGDETVYVGTSVYEEFVRV